MTALTHGRNTDPRAIAFALAACLLVVVLGVADLMLTVVHENGVGSGVDPTHLLGTAGFVFSSLAFAVMGTLVIARQPSNRIGWVMLMFGPILELQSFTSDYPIMAVLSPHHVLPLRTWSNWMSAWSFDPLIYALFLLLMLFPTGRLISPRLRPVIWIGTGATFALTLLDMFQRGLMRNGSINAWANPAGLVTLPEAVYRVMVIAGVLAVFAAALCVLRRLWVARGVERQQLKWFSYAIVALLIIFVGDVITNRFSGIQGLLLMITVIAVPVSMAIAILRYRLYDIDLLINRTLVYGSLTVVLAGLYVGQIIAFQALFRAITGQQSDIAVAISTLVIAAAFNPLRHRVQDLIARTFYRRKYNAAQVLAAFGATCRDETDLGRLHRRLVSVVQETLQPEHVSLWLRD